MNGPTQAQVTSAYAATTLTEYVAVIKPNHGTNRFDPSRLNPVWRI